MSRVTIVPAAGTAGELAEPIVLECGAGSTLFEAGARAAAAIDTACVGKGTCGLCRVKILAGKEHLNAFTDEERKHLGNVYHITKVRLSCRSKVDAGDVAFEIVRKKKR